MLEELKMYRLYDPDVHVGICWNSWTSYSKDDSAPFTATPFTRARKQKQYKCTSADGWTIKLWLYKNTMEIYSATKKNVTMEFSGNLMIYIE